MGHLGSRLALLASFLVWLDTLAASSDRQLTPTNLLFIIFDDLRPELKVYGKSHMITPNFDRLAAKSVVFDHAYAQVAVCNPSRDSLLTGLRPDTLGNYAFQTSFKPHLLFPTQLSRSGYKTSSFGKVLHWDGNDKEVWNTEQYWGEWYDNQNKEWDTARSTVWPDKAKNVSSFYDYDFATRAIASLRGHAAAQKDWFMTAIGFKLPHTLLHMPHTYFDLYRSHFQPNFTKDMLVEEDSRYTRFPDTCPSISYRCCAGEQFRYMHEEGEKRWKDQLHLRLPDLNLTRAFPARMHKELLWGYSAAITFVDAQLGRVLDAVDELRLWDNLTIVLTADHGMHNGEKGIWEKWSMFDESTRVPLMIYHPLSPFGGQHYTDPVELIDVFPTVIDLLNPPFNRNKIYNAPRTRHPRRIVPLAGKSLAPMVLGREWIPLLSSVRAHPLLGRDYYFPVMAEGARTDKGGAAKRRVRRDGRGALPVPAAMPLHRHQFALSQIWRCSPKVLTHLDARNESDRKSITAWFMAHRKENRVIQFLDCDLRNSSQAIQREEDSFMGYSMRTKEFRYTLWIPFDRASMTPQWDDRSTGRNSTIGVFAEELFDHRGETLARELGTKELVNLAGNANFALIKYFHRQRLLDFLRSRVLYKAATPSNPPKLWLQASGFNAVHRAVLDN